MRVENSDSNKISSKRSNQNRRSKKNYKSAPTQNFKTILETFNNSQSKIIGTNIDSSEDLQEALDNIHQLGEKFLAQPNIDSLAKYKQAIRNVMTYITQRTYITQEQISRKDILNQKKYVIINTIDSKLELLSRNLIASQKQQFTILSALEEIQGLLVDLFHVS